MQLRNKYRAHCRKLASEESANDERMAESIAFFDLTTFVSNSVEAGTYIFQLPELHDLYANRLKRAVGV